MASSNSDKRSRQERAEQMRKERERSDSRRRNGITVAVVIVVLVLIAAAGYAIKNQVDANNAPAAVPANLRDGVGIVYDKQAATGEPADGDPVTVVAYEDFQCPGCRAFEQSDGDFLRKSVESGDIIIEYRPIAFLDRSSSTNYSTRSLNAAACVLDAKGVKAFHKMHDNLYQNQPEEGTAGLPDDQLVQFAEQAGAPDAGSCIDDGTYKDWAAEVTDKASDAKVGSTPTIRIDGKEVTGPKQNGQTTIPRVKDLQAAIAEAKK